MDDELNTKLKSVGNNNIRVPKSFIDGCTSLVRLRLVA